MKISLIKIPLIGLLAAAIITHGQLYRAWQWNMAGVSALKGQKAEITTAVPDCDHIWLTRVLYDQYKNQPGLRQILEQAINCSEANVSIIQAVLPNDKELAQLSVIKYPDSWKAWFWLGEITTPTDPVAARDAYSHTVNLDPTNGLAWCRLGYNYEQRGDKDNALQAYLKCCINGDPGSHGCYGAGQITEQMGDIRQAIQYYRLSRWAPSLEHAKELEAILNP